MKITVYLLVWNPLKPKTIQNEQTNKQNNKQTKTNEQKKIPSDVLWCFIFHNMFCCLILSGLTVTAWVGQSFLLSF